MVTNKILIDGYNVIYLLPGLSEKRKNSLENSRNALVVLVSLWKQRMSFRGDICIVFDGQDNIISRRGTVQSDSRCVFTRSKEEADDRIISMVRDSQEPQKIMVISADNKVGNGSRAHGASVKSPQYLLEIKTRTKISKIGSKSSISSARKIDINNYYRKILEESI